MFQMGGVGPMFGQANHFRRFAKEEVPYAIERYTTEAHRLYGVMDRRLAEHDFLAGDRLNAQEHGVFTGNPTQQVLHPLQQVAVGGWIVRLSNRDPERRRRYASAGGLGCGR